MVPIPDKLSVVFFTALDIKFGGGGEQALIEYVKNAPNDFDITVVHTDFLPGGTSRLSEDEINRMLSKARVFKIKSPNVSFDFLRKNKISLVFLNYFIRPFFISLAMRLRNSETLKSIQKTNLVYLFQNEYAHFFNSKKSVIVGSTHIMDIWHMKWIKKALDILYGRNLFSNKISAFHILHYPVKNVELLGGRKYEVIPNGVDAASFYPVKRTVHTLKFLFSARLEPNKGLMVVLNAWNRLILSNPNFDVELHISGSGSVNVQSNNKMKIVYHGFLNRVDLANLFGTCDVFLAPTMADTFSIVTLEALSSGMYVIASNHLKGVFDEFERMNALTYCSPNEDSFYNLMVQVYQNFNYNLKNRAIVHQYVEENYSWQAVCNKLYAFLRSLTRTITELEHHDDNIIEKNRYIKSMRKVVFQIVEVSS